MSQAKLAILGALMERPMHGYELRKYFEHAQGVFWMINYGSIYPTLRSLESDGLVEGRTEEAGGMKRRKTYTITGKGKKEFRTMLEERLNTEAFVRDEFTLHLFFMDYLDKKVIKGIIEKKIKGNEWILEHIGEHESKLKDELPKFRYETVKRGRMHIETELSWLKDLMKSI